MNFFGVLLSSFGIVVWIISVLVGILIFFIIRELWFSGIRKEIIDLYNKQLDFENKFSKIEALLRTLVRMEKCRMIEEGFIDGEANKFTNWNIDKDLKPHKVNVGEVKNETQAENCNNDIIDENKADLEIEVKKEKKTLLDKIRGIFKKVKN